MKEELEQLKITLTTKSDELLQLNLELALHNSQLSASVQELSAENADFKVTRVGLGRLLPDLGAWWGWQAWHALRPHPGSETSSLGNCEQVTGLFTGLS